MERVFDPRSGWLGFWSLHVGKAVKFCFGVEALSEVGTIVKKLQRLGENKRAADAFDLLWHCPANSIELFSQ